MGISALIILIFFVPYTASGFSACGKLFNTIFGWDYHTAMLISAIVIIAYTCSGGFLAASFTDLIQSMISARAVLVVIAVLGVLLAWDQNSSVFRVVSFAWAGFGATFGPVMLAALFWKRSNKYGAMAGMIAGGIMVFAWKFGIANLGGVFATYELLPAFLTALIAIVVVSLATSAPEKEIENEYDKVLEEINK